MNEAAISQYPQPPFPPLLRCQVRELVDRWGAAAFGEMKSNQVVIRTRPKNNPAFESQRSSPRVFACNRLRIPQAAPTPVRNRPQIWSASKAAGHHIEVVLECSPQAQRGATVPLPPMWSPPRGEASIAVGLRALLNLISKVGQSPVSQSSRFAASSALAIQLMVM